MKIALPPRIRLLPVAVRSVLLVSIINRLGSYVQQFLALYCVAVYGRSAAQASYMVAAYGVGALVATLLGGLATDFFGSRRIMLVSHVGGMLSVVALALTPAPHWLLAVIVMSGFCIELARPPTTTLISHYLSGEALVRAYGLNYIMINVGFMFSPLLGSLLVGYGFPILFGGNAFVLLLCALITWRWIVDAPGARTVQHTKVTAGSAAPIPYAVLTVLMIIGFCFVALMVQTTTALPLYMHQELGLPTWQYGVVLATNGVGVLCMAYPLAGWLAKRPPLLCSGAGVALFGLGSALNAVFTTMPGLMAAMWLSTLGEVVAATVMSGLLAEMIPAHLRGRVFGIHHAIGAAAGMLSPLLGGIVLANVGYHVFWLLLGLLGLAGLGVAYWGNALYRNFRQKFPLPMSSADPPVPTFSDGLIEAGAAL